MTSDEAINKAVLLCAGVCDEIARHVDGNVSPAQAAKKCADAMRSLIEKLEPPKEA